MLFYRRREFERRRTPNITVNSVTKMLCWRRFRSDELFRFCPSGREHGPFFGYNAFRDGRFQRRTNTRARRGVSRVENTAYTPGIVVTYIRATVIIVGGDETFEFRCRHVW